jgi:methylamine--corrinoid protein Co-methyltransferase
MLWLVSLVHQALARNSRILSTSNGFFNAGPGTDMLLYEVAAHALASTVSGGDLWEAAPAHNKLRNHATPLEARLACEVGHAAAARRMSRVQANDIATRLLSKYEAQIANAPEGKPFQECYDVRKIQPMRWYTELFNRVKEELTQMGVQFPY